MGYPHSTPNWQHLGQLRRRGQRPVGPVYLIADAGKRQRLWQNKGLYTLPPQGGEAVMLSGLEVLLMVPRTPQNTELAQTIAAANPRRFQIEWEGEGWQCVISP